MTEYNKELVREKKKPNSLCAKLVTRLWCLLAGVATILNLSNTQCLNLLCSY